MLIDSIAQFQNCNPCDLSTIDQLGHLCYLWITSSLKLGRLFTRSLGNLVVYLVLNRPQNTIDVDLGLLSLALDDTGGADHLSGVSAGGSDGVREWRRQAVARGAVFPGGRHRHDGARERRDVLHDAPYGVLARLRDARSLPYPLHGVKTRQEPASVQVQEN